MRRMERREKKRICHLAELKLDDYITGDDITIFKLTFYFGVDVDGANV